MGKIVDMVVDEIAESGVISNTIKGLFKNWKTVLLVILWSFGCMAFGYILGSTDLEDVEQVELNDGN